MKRRALSGEFQFELSRWDACILLRVSLHPREGRPNILNKDDDIDLLYSLQSPDSRPQSGMNQLIKNKHR